MSHEALVAADPDFIVICPCGLDLEQTRKELPALTTQPWWCALSCRKAAGQVAPWRAYSLWLQRD